MTAPKPMNDELGTVRNYRGQTYEFVGSEPYTTRKDDEISLRLWLSDCADCGAKFHAKVTSRTSKFAPSRRCQRCKKPGVRVVVTRAAERHLIKTGSA